MSVGGDGKGKRDKEPDPPESSATSGDGAVAGHSVVDDSVADDVPPYEAVTEVMRAIDPNEPLPGQSVSQTEPAVPGEGAEFDEPTDRQAAVPGGPTESDSTSLSDDAPVSHREAEPSGAVDPGAVLPSSGGPSAVDPGAVDPDAVNTHAVNTHAVDANAANAEDTARHSSAAHSPEAAVSSEAAVEAGAEDRADDSSTVAIPVVEPPAGTEPPAGAEPTAGAGPPAGAGPSDRGDSYAGPAVSPSGEDVVASTRDVKASRMKIAVIVGAAVAILGVFYTADLLSSDGSVPRGVVVAGVEVGGLSHEDAEARLQSELGPRVDQTVRVNAGDRELELVPSAAGLDIDWASTLDRAGSQPINPFTRIASFFSSTEIGVVSTVDPVALDGAVESIRAQTDREPAEGDVVFEGAEPVAVTPAPGQSLDVPATREVLESDWPFGTVDVPVATVDVTVHQDEVDRVLAEVATPAVSAPVVFAGRNGTEAVLTPDAIARVLSFEPDGEGALAPRYDFAAATGLLAPALASTETPPKDATFRLGAGAPTVVPAVVGDVVQWERTLEQLPALLTSQDSRTTDAVYDQAQPALTTEGAQALGIKEVVGEYTTGGFEYASGVNIGLTADIVNGALVKPGATFSLNEYTGPRGSAQGFVESGIIDNGRPDRAVGGGISQFATTLYNASYFGGMEDAGHTEHSYYISRYPEAREATVFEGAIDLKFTNPAKTGIVIESFATSSNVTVRLWGTKTVEVESVTGARTNPTSPNTITLPAGAGCVASGGGPGFTASDTRVITDIASGNQISSNTRTVKYDPIPIVKCVSPEPERAPSADPDDEPPAAAPPAEDE